MRNIAKIFGISLSLLLQVSAAALAQDLTRMGGDLTSSDPLAVALELPAPNIASEERFQYHLAGHAEFHSSFEFVRKEGHLVLGPLFNNKGCGSCHFKDGRGVIDFNPNSDASSTLIKVALKGLKPDGSPRNVPGVGEQLRDHSITGKRLFDITLRWIKIRGHYPDGVEYNLRSPVYGFKIPNIDPKKVVYSPRITPPVIGMGLLEAVSEEDIIAASDPNDSNHDGISGRVSYVPDASSPTKIVGRFGFRATHATLRQQSGAAFFNDMGMTNPIFNNTKKAPEVDDDAFDKTVFYQQAAGVTPGRDQDSPDVQSGKQLFQQINCSGCHFMTLHTGPTSIPELVNQEFHPFTDLLLHDMGPKLADKRAEFSASGREWRTTPLWGLGLVRVLAVPGGRIGFLHDGRARTIEEAILWHGGEAKKSVRDFKLLTKLQRDQLIAFLRSL